MNIAVEYISKFSGIRPKNKFASHFGTPNAKKSAILAQFSGGIIFRIGLKNPQIKMSYKVVITQLYYILISADGQVNDHERASGKWLAKAEGIDLNDFDVQVELLKSKDKAALLTDCIKALRKLSRNEQIRTIAWLCVIANGDGFMDKAEWQLIYRIYHKELSLPLEEIFKVQKEINRLPRERMSVNGFLNSAV